MASRTPRWVRPYWWSITHNDHRGTRETGYGPRAKGVPSSTVLRVTTDNDGAPLVVLEVTTTTTNGATTVTAYNPNTGERIRHTTREATR